MRNMVLESQIMEYNHLSLLFLHLVMCFLYPGFWVLINLRPFFGHFIIASTETQLPVGVHVPDG